MKRVAVKELRGAVILLFLHLFFLHESFGQELKQELILPGPDKTLLVVAGVFPAADGSRKFAPANETLLIERADEGKRSFKKIGEVRFPSSANDLQERLGVMAEEVKTKLQVQSMQDAYQLLRRVGSDTLGMLLINPDLQEALGLTFVDRTRDPAKASTYRFVKQIDGKDVQEKLIEVSAKLPTYQEKYTLAELASSDSAVTVNWYASTLSSSSPFPLFARVYRQQAHHAGFTEQARVFVTTGGLSDSSFVRYSDRVTPGSNLGYYIQVEDFAGNKGTASDTIYTISVSRGSIKPILNLAVKDTLEGMLLTWDPIPDEALYGGVQILKSRKVSSDFVVLDTIPIQETRYFDDKVISSTAYYYRVRPLLVTMPNSDPLLYAEVSGYIGKKDEEIPETPSAVNLQVGKEGIEVSWQQGHELNLFGYYVLRGTSSRDMQVISAAVQDTRFVDTTMVPGFSGQLQYAIQAISLNQQVSDTSAISSIAIQQPVNLSPPGGLQARWSDAGVALQWDDVQLRDDKVEGFMLYRKSAGAKGFEPITKEILHLPFFSDTTALTSESYTYAITSIDSWGNQSIFSPTSDLKAQNMQAIVLPQELYLRNLRTGIEVFWPETDFKTVEQYVIYRKQIGQNQFVKIGNAVPGEPFIDKQVESHQLYEYSLRTVTSAGEGAVSVSNTIRRN